MSSNQETLTLNSSLNLLLESKSIESRVMKVEIYK